MNEFHKAACVFAQHGMAVFPLQPKGKKPATASGLKQATTDISIIDRWWSEGPEMNVGVCTGAVSGVFVLDIDGMAGEQTLAELEKLHGALPQSIESITGGGGRHIFFRLGDGDPVRNSAGKLGPGLDVRGDGGYIVAPPSRHPSGRRYTWSVDSANEFAGAPDWLLEKIAEHANGKGRPLEQWHALLCEPIANGVRNSTIAEICGKLLFHSINLVLVRDLLLCVNAARCDPPLSPDEVDAITASVARTHLRRNGADG